MMNPLQNGDLQLFKETNFSLDAFQQATFIKPSSKLKFFQFGFTFTHINTNQLF